MMWDSLDRDRYELCDPRAQSQKYPLPAGIYMKHRSNEIEEHNIREAAEVSKHLKTMYRTAACYL